MIDVIFCYLKVSDSWEVLRDLTGETQNVQVSNSLHNKIFSVPDRKGGNHSIFLCSYNH